MAALRISRLCLSSCTATQGKSAARSQHGRGTAPSAGARAGSPGPWRRRAPTGAVPGLGTAPAAARAHESICFHSVHVLLTYWPLHGRLFLWHDKHLNRILKNHHNWREFLSLIRIKHIYDNIWKTRLQIHTFTYRFEMPLALLI